MRMGRLLWASSIAGVAVLGNFGLRKLGREEAKKVLYGTIYIVGGHELDVISRWHAITTSTLPPD